jgi:hypothetical protein
MNLQFLCIGMLSMVSQSKDYRLDTTKLFSSSSSLSANELGMNPAPPVIRIFTI